MPVIIEGVPISGTNGDDNPIIADFAAADAIFQYFEDGITDFAQVWNRTVLALNGDDYIVRDRPGDYKNTAGDDHVEIFGHAGEDTVSYELYGAGIEAKLQHNGVGGWDGDGWVKAYGGTPPGETIYGRDILYDVENLRGTAFADLIRGSSGANDLYGDEGDDVIYGKGGNDFIFGGEDDDTLYGNAGVDTIQGEDGDDTIYGGDDGDFLYGGAGDNLIFGGQGADTIILGGGEAHGGNDNDIIVGGNGNDELYGDAGDDILQGLGGDDLLNGGTGHDQIDGGAGSDTAEYTGNANVYAALDNLGDGLVIQGAYADSVESVENLRTANGNDQIDLGSNANKVWSGGGDDVVNTNGGADNVFGGDGDDEINTGSGNDLAYGDGGNDTINAGSGNDFVYGGDGFNNLRGGQGNDTMVAGNDVDNFHWEVGDTGVDTVHNFAIGTDRIVFGTGYLDMGPGDSVSDLVVAVAANGGADTMLFADTGNGWFGGFEAFATLKGLDVADVEAAIGNELLFDGAVVVGPGGHGAPGGYVPVTRDDDFGQVVDMGGDFIM